MVNSLCGVTKPVFILDKCQKEVGFRVYSAPCLVQRCVTCFLAEFFGRLLNVRKLRTESIEWVIFDWNQLDAVV